jgi:hypothetical protein
LPIRTIGKDFANSELGFGFRRRNNLGLVLENLCFDVVLAGEDGGAAFGRQPFFSGDESLRENRELRERERERF